MITFKADVDAFIHGFNASQNVCVRNMWHVWKLVCDTEKKPQQKHFC